MNNYIAHIRHNDKDVIVSLTSYRERILQKTYIYTIQSLLQQDFQGLIGIVLVLTKDEISYIEKQDLDFLQKNNIEILTAQKDIRPHKKYFYTMLEYRNKPIITVDDDSIYPKDLVTNLFNRYKKYGNKIVYSARNRIMQFNKKGFPTSYQTWKLCNKDGLKSFNLIPTGVGGVLYPPNVFKLTNDHIKEIHGIIYENDDILLKKFENDNKIQVMHVECGERKDQECSRQGLYQKNISQNDQIIKACKLKKITK